MQDCGKKVIAFCLDKLNISVLKNAIDICNLISKNSSRPWQIIVRFTRQEVRNRLFNRKEYLKSTRIELRKYSALHCFRKLIDN